MKACIVLCEVVVWAFTVGGKWLSLQAVRVNAINAAVIAAARSRGMVLTSVARTDAAEELAGINSQRLEKEPPEPALGLSKGLALFETWDS